MAVLAPNRPRRWLRWWLVPLLVFGFLAVTGFAALHWFSPASDGSDSDSELIHQQVFAGPHRSPEEVRAQIGEERFWRVIRSAITGRPSDGEIRFREWMRSGYGRRPSALQAAIDKLQPRLEEGWGQRENRFNETMMILRTEYGNTVTPILPELIGLAESGRREYATEGIEALANLREGAVGAVPMLFRRLESDRGDLVWDLAYAIGQIDPQSSQSAGRMLELLRKVSKPRRIVILPVIGLFALHQPELATNLWPALHEDHETAQAAIRGLNYADQLTSERIEPFRKEFASDDANERWVALNLVVNSDASVMAGFVPELRRVALHQSPTQSAALEALKTLFSQNPSQPPSIRLAAAEALVASDNATAAWGALIGLSSLGADEVQTWLPITEALAHPSPNVRAKAAELLGKLGPAARPALPQLRALQNDQWKMVRDAVEIALPKIGE